MSKEITCIECGGVTESMHRIKATGLMLCTDCLPSTLITKLKRIVPKNIQITADNICDSLALISFSKNEKTVRIWFDVNSAEDDLRRLFKQEKLMIFIKSGLKGF